MKLNCFQNGLLLKNIVQLHLFLRKEVNGYVD